MHALDASVELYEIEEGVHVVKGGVHVVKGSVHVFGDYTNKNKTSCR